MKKQRGVPLSAKSDPDPLAEAYNRGLAAEKSGDLAAAAEAYREVLALDPADHGGVTVRLASLGLGDDPDKAPDAYVATLFDQTAETFDAILVEQLGYEVPELVARKLAALDLGPFTRTLDLGCGTGLMGWVLGDRAGELTGVDLAEEMLAQTDDRDCYDQLFVGEAVQFLEEEETRFDLIAATDVLPYIGALEAFFAALAPCLDAGGVVALSSETLPDEAFDARGWRVGPRNRFAHAEGYIRRLMASHKIEVLAFDPITVRLEDGEPVPGHLIIGRI
ncbi:methyltransferase domain-containing protein [Rhodobacteraceae bacterium NNCM2]|nr:methyltransferase domain-containing protein [Coraliihabitans acroporae]